MSVEDPERPHSIARSEWRHTNDGEVRRWPNRADYEEWYRAMGEIEADVPFEEAYHVHARTFMDWAARGQTACRFASVLARHPEESRWQSVTITSELGWAEIADVTDRILRDSLGKDELVQLLFPAVVTPEDLCQLINSLTVDGSNWYWERLDDSGNGEVCVGLRWVLPSKEYVAWTVGFGPFEFFPFTRRGPITAIVVRTSEAKRTRYELSKKGTIPVHLADVDDRLESKEIRQKLTEATIEAKKKYLDGEYVEAARARVTFRIPAEHASLLAAPS